MIPKNTAHANTKPWMVPIKLLPSEILLATNFNVSSMRMTGTENFMTVIHSSMLNGVTWKTPCEGQKVIRTRERLTSDGGTYRESFNVQDDEMKGEWQAHRSDQPHVDPWRHGNERLIFWQAEMKLPLESSTLQHFKTSHLFIAFNISIVTRTERAMVIGWGSWKTLQSTPLKSSPPPRHCIWWDNCQNVNWGPFSQYMNHQVAPPTVAAPTYPPIAM